ncbi:MAG: hypothetical protein ABEJ75_01515 [Candidatus Nanohaloarchaea archaeon]
MPSKGGGKLTYGIGIFAVTGLVAIMVIVMVGLMYTSSADCTRTNSGWSDEPVKVKDFGIEKHVLKIQFVNAGTGQITLTDLTLKRKNTEIRRELESTLAVGASTVARIDGFNRSESCNTFDVRLKYDKAGLENLRASGDITWNIES